MATTNTTPTPTIQAAKTNGQAKAMPKVDATDFRMAPAVPTSAPDMDIVTLHSMLKNDVEAFKTFGIRGIVNLPSGNRIKTIMIANFRIEMLGVDRYTVMLNDDTSWCLGREITKKEIVARVEWFTNLNRDEYRY